MKKKILATLILSAIICITLAFNVSADGYDNFTKVRDYNELLDKLISEKSRYYSANYLYNAKTDNSWYFEYVKNAYELGLLELASADFYFNFGYEPKLIDVVNSYSKIAAKYLENTMYDNSLSYAKNIGLITPEEYSKFIKGEYNTSKNVQMIDSNSLHFDYSATRKDMQVLTTRLFKIIHPGEEINNFTKIVDVNSIKTPNVSEEGVLQLYNLGIIVGNSFGMFMPYDHLSMTEFATILNRICIPSLRKKVDESSYDKLFEQSVNVKSYKSLTNDEVNNYVTANKIEALYTNKLNDTDIVTYEDVLTTFHSITNANVQPYKISSILNSLYGGFPINLYITQDNVNRPAEKTKAAVLAMYFATEKKYIQITSTQCIKPEFIQNFNIYEIPYINKALSIGLLENTADDLNTSYLTKSDLNKMLTIFGNTFYTNYAYNSIMYGDDIAHIVTDPTKLPSNASIYPYILDFAPKEVYELVPDEIEHSPVLLDKNIRRLYTNAMTNFDTGLDAVVNIDYRYNVAEKLRDSDLYYISLTYGERFEREYERLIKEYEQYVIDNEIILTGNVTPLFPIVFMEKDAGIYRVRVKFEFEVIHSKTNKNLLLYDKDVTYNGNKFEVYVDLYAGGNVIIGYSIASFECFMRNIVYGGENIIVNKS